MTETDVTEQAEIALGRAEGSIEEQIIRMSMLNYEPLPMLEVIAARLVLSLASSFKTQTAAITEVTLREFDYTSYSRAMQALPEQGLLAVCQADPWDHALILSMDSDFLFAALELMLGGKPTKGRLTSVERNFTSIERRMGQRLAELMLADLGEGFRQIAEVSFRVERMEGNPHFATIAQPNSAAVRIGLDVSFEGAKGKLAIVIPYATLDPIRPLLTKVFYGERLGGDESWRQHLSERIEGSTVTLTALLHERAYPMADVLNWKPGDTVDLMLEEDAPATVLCSGVAMFRGAMGKKQNGSTAVRITEDLNQAKGLSDDVGRD